jgi:hypothetical protein
MVRRSRSTSRMGSPMRFGWNLDPETRTNRVGLNNLPESIFLVQQPCFSSRNARI